MRTVPVPTISTATCGESPEKSKFPVVLAGFCSFLSLFATQPLLPEFIRIFHGTEASVSLTVGAATMGVAVAAPLTGSIADRLGRKRMIVLSAWLVALSSFAAATATSLPVLIGWRFIQG